MPPREYLCTSATWCQTSTQPVAEEQRREDKTALLAVLRVSCLMPRLCNIACMCCHCALMSRCLRTLHSRCSSVASGYWTVRHHARNSIGPSCFPLIIRYKHPERTTRPCITLRAGHQARSARIACYPAEGRPCAQTLPGNIAMRGQLEGNLPTHQPTVMPAAQALGATSAGALSRDGCRIESSMRSRCKCAAMAKR
jgi:hypothetical protein